MTLYIYPHEPQKEKYMERWRNSFSNKDYELKYIYPSRHIDIIDALFIQMRMNSFIEEARDSAQDVKFVAMGYSPLVAISFLIAHNSGIETVYFSDDAETGELSEVSLQCY